MKTVYSIMIFLLLFACKSAPEGFYSRKSRFVTGNYEVLHLDASNKRGVYNNYHDGESGYTYDACEFIYTLSNDTVYVEFYQEGCKKYLQDEFNTFLVRRNCLINIETGKKYKFNNMNPRF